MSGTRLRGPLALLCALLAGSSLLVAVDACTIVNGLTVPEDAAAQRETGASDAGSDGPIDPCMHAYPPPKPSAADTPTDLSILVAAKRFTLGTPVGSIPPGLDLDNACSCPPAVPDTCVGKKDHCDAVGGRDNAAGSLFNTLLGAPGPQKIDFEERINSGIRAGRNTILLGVDHFNGTNDDPDVSVSVYATVGLLDGSGNNVAPTFTDADRWALDARQFPVTQTFPRATTQGYVAGGKLVASLDVTLDLNDSFSIALSGSTIVADVALNGPGGKPTITGGLLAGRWPIADLLRVAGEVHLEDGGKRVCDTPLAYLTVKQLACQEADILADRKRDGKGADCDALSAALVFEGAPASKGAVITVTPQVGCPDAAPDDCTK